MEKTIYGLPKTSCNIPMPQVKPPKLENDWVSVKDRLPEKAGKYLITISEGGSVHTTVRRFNPKPSHPEQTEPVFTRYLPYRSGWERGTAGVIAWKPLPEPYHPPAAEG